MSIDIIDEGSIGESSNGTYRLNIPNVQDSYEGTYKCVVVDNDTVAAEGTDDLSVLGEWKLPFHAVHVMETAITLQASDGNF